MGRCVWSVRWKGVSGRSRFLRKIHGVYIQPGLSCMQERTDTLLRRLEELELVQRDSTTRMEGLLPRVEDFLVKFAGTNETQMGALSKGLVEVGEVVKGLLSRESQPNTTDPMDPEVVLVLRREVESLRRATENLPQAYLKLKNEVQT